MAAMSSTGIVDAFGASEDEARKERESPESIPPLPSELRALVDFLSLDQRPTAIFHLSRRASDLDEDEPLLIHCNPAFQNLVGLEKELQDLRDAIARAWQGCKDNRDLHGRVLGGRKWQIRVSLQYCITVPADPRDESDVERQQSMKQAMQGSQSHRPNDVSEGKPSLDWLQFSSPEMLPWTEFVRGIDWASTALGPVEDWSITLRQYVLSITSNPNPRLIVYGKEMSFIYNQACVQLFGNKHPRCMGAHVSVPWSEIWNDLKPILESVYRGQTVKLSNLHLPLNRKGFLEETYWNSTLLPLHGPSSEDIGVYDELTETTLLVTGERRRAAIERLSEHITGSITLSDLWSRVLEALEDVGVDIPFALLYAVADGSGNDMEADSSSFQSSCASSIAQLVGTVGLSADQASTFNILAIQENTQPKSELTAPFLRAWKSQQPVLLKSSDGSLPASLAVPVEGRSFDDPVKTALISPIKSSTGSEIIGALVTGLNTRCLFENEYKLFMTILIDIVERAAALISLPEEQRRAKKISDNIQMALMQQLKLTTLKAERSEKKFSRLAETAPTGMFMFDVEGRPLYVNDTYLGMMGRTEEQYSILTSEAWEWTADIHEDDLDRFMENWKHMTEQKAPITMEYRLKKPWRSVDKSLGHEISSETWLLITAFPEIEADGTVTAVQGWLTDISHKKFSENLLAQRLEDALENKRQTENFIDMTSHEMRNPLSAMLQSADSIVSMLASIGISARTPRIEITPQIAEDIVDAAQTIILCAQHQKRIVDDILTLSKLDASLLVISPDKVQVPTLVTKALKMYEAEIERAGIEAQLCIEPSYEELGIDWMTLDASRLLQVIINLLTNSIKFTQYSDVRMIKICIGASYRRPSGKHHGISFVPPRRPRATSRRPRTDRSLGEDIYLQIGVYDTGRGLNENEMKVLFQRFSQASPKTYKQYGGSGLGLFISRELCELQGGQIGVASGGGRTVFAFFIKAKRWMDEDEAALSRSLEHFTSASASPMAFSRRGSVLMQDVTNQMTCENIDDRGILEAFHPNSQPLSRKPSFTGTAPTMEQTMQDVQTTNDENNLDLHVLIVEDNLINQKVLSHQLRRAGCIVHVANHGVECLDFLQNSTFCSADTPLSIVLLDLEMPTMDGLTCIKHIRQWQAQGRINAHVPVIAVTANARSEQIATAIETGMDQVVTKPFRIPELVPQMQRLVLEVAAQAIANTNGR